MATAKHRSSGNFAVKERLNFSLKFCGIVADLKAISFTIKTLDFYSNNENPVKSVIIKQIS